jgi:pimeloyl-ACP methyl ester carboxylesterase
MQLHTQTWGDTGQPAALLIHGLYLDSNTWWRFGPDLAQRGFHVIAPDLRGHGRSRRGNRYSPADWANDVIDTLYGTNFDVAIGHSLGGLVLALAAHALRPSRLLYLDPAWRITATQDAAFRQQWLSWLSWTKPEHMRHTVGANWDADDLDLSWRGFQHTDPAVIPGLAAGAGYDHSPESAPAPVLVVAADPSEFITAEHAHDLVTRGLTVERPSGSSHFWFRDDYTAFCRRVFAWIDATSPSASDLDLHPMIQKERTSR